MIYIKHNIILFLLTAVYLVSCTENRIAEDSTSIEVNVLHKWDGDFPVEALDQLPLRQQDQPVGYITDADIFAGFWSRFKPGEILPEINFNDNMVVYHRNIAYFNRISIFKVTLQKGILEVMARETMSATPVEDMVAISVVVIPKSGIEFIKSGEEKLTVRFDRET